jgi:hypothetical protein
MPGLDLLTSEKSWVEKQLALIAPYTRHHFSFPDELFSNFFDFIWISKTSTNAYIYLQLDGTRNAYCSTYTYSTYI